MTLAVGGTLNPNQSTNLKRTNRKPNEQLKTIYLNVTAIWRSDSRTMVEYCSNRGLSYGIHVSSGFALGHKSGISNCGKRNGSIWVPTIHLWATKRKLKIVVYNRKYCIYKLS